MTIVSFWGGVGKIGGNKILISPENINKKSILLDFGKDFSKEYLDTFLNPRKFNLIEDYITLGFIPEPKPGTPFHGLYREDLYYFKYKVSAATKVRELGIIESDNNKFLNIHIPCKNIKVLEAKYYGNPQFGYNISIVFSIEYGGIREKINLTQKHLNKFITFFKIDEDNLFTLISKAGLDGTEEIKESLNIIIKAFGDKLTKIDCSFFNEKWYIFNISGEVNKQKYDYKQNYQRNYEIWNKRFGYDPIGEPQISHVLITHSHSDHVSDIKIIDPRVINVSSKISKEFLDHFKFIQSDTFSGITQYKENFILVPYRSDETKLRRGYKKDIEMKERSFITLNSNEELTLDYFLGEKKVTGAFKIKFHEVDHSTSGAGAYLIEDIENNKRIIYTGDIRMHGPSNLKQKTLNFIEIGRRFEPDVLICEGTNISSSREKGEVESEDILEEKITKIIEETNGLVMFACSLRDLSRINSFFKAAKNNRRKLAIMPNTYKLIERLNFALKDKKYNIKGDYSNIPPLDKDLVPYLSRKGWGLYEKEDYTYSPASKNMFEEETKQDFEINNQVKLIIIDEIANNQELYVIYLPFWSLFSLIDLHPVPGSVFIHSKSEPFEPEMELEHEKLMNWLKLVKIEERNFYQVHCSGHARKKDLEYIINQIKPKVVFPIHTQFPNLFLTLKLNDIKTIIPEYGKKYII